jgi:hypothetical protein
LKNKNNIIYVLVSIFLFLSNIYAIDKIEQYYQLCEKLKKYETILSEKFKDKDIKICDDVFLEHIESTVKATSEFAKTCINLSTLSKDIPKVTKGNMILQTVVAAYVMLQTFFEIIKYKKDQKNLVDNMAYLEMVTMYPHLVLIEYQFKIIRLLLEMDKSSDLMERAFARINLVTVVLPGPYEAVSKKFIKKIYKKYFNLNGDLVSLEPIDEKLYNKFLKTIVIDWQYLVLKVQKFPLKISFFQKSDFSDVLEAPMNQKIFEMIQATKEENFEKLYALKPNILEKLLQELYDFCRTKLKVDLI